MNKNNYNKKAIPRKIRIADTNDRDFQDVILGALIGLGGKAIARNADYSLGQVYYRVKAGGFRFRDYRSGNWISNEMLKKIRADRHIVLQIRREIEEQMKYSKKK
jgi:hypothetical protein